MAGTCRALTGTPPVPDSGHGRYADRYATSTHRASTGTPQVPQGQVTSTPRRAGEGQAPGTPFPIVQPGCTSAQLAHPAASIHDVQPPYGVRRVELFPLRRPGPQWHRPVRCLYLLVLFRYLLVPQHLMGCLVQHLLLSHLPWSAAILPHWSVNPTLPVLIRVWVLWQPPL